MADDQLRALSVAIEANTRGIQKSLDRLVSQNKGAFRKIESDAGKSIAGLNRALATADKRMAGFGKTLVPSLGALTAALSTRQIVRYAEAWKTAQNALSVAGVTGREQVKVLNALYDAAQKNAAPIGALADLYSKASQAADVLGANQQSLIKFSAGVATALRVAGTSAGAASGALTQLSQLLAAGTVRAEEFNSVNEQARPILQAVAAGMERTGGSVAKLRSLVVDGEVSSREFFESFLKGLPKIEAMAANTTSTIAQSMTRVENAFTKFIGETDESLGASQRLVAGLNALANNFDATADIALQLASVLAGALVGRGLVSVIGKTVLATEALVSFSRALAAARTVSFASALGGLSSAAGPLGWIIGGALVGSMIMFTSRSSEAATGAKTYAEALREVEEAAQNSATAVDEAGMKFVEQSKNSLAAGVKTGIDEIAAARDAAVKLFSEIIDNAPRRLISEEQLAQLRDLRDGLANGSVEAKAANESLYALANANPKFQKLADQMKPLLDALGKAIAATGILKNQLEGIGDAPSFRDFERESMAAYKALKEAGDKFIDDAQRRNALSKEELAIENEIARIKAEAEKAGVVLTEKRIRDLAAANVEADKRRSGEGKADRADEYERLTQRIKEATAAQLHENQVLGRANPLLNDYGFNLAKARTESDLLAAAMAAGTEITPELVDEIGRLATGYAKSVSAGNRLADVQEKIRREAEEMSSIMKDTFTSMVDALFEAGDIGEKLIDIFANLGRSFSKLNVEEAWSAI